MNKNTGEVNRLMEEDGNCMLDAYTTSTARIQ